jgi:hypothetical protein
MTNETDLPTFAGAEGPADSNDPSAQGSAEGSGSGSDRTTRNSAPRCHPAEVLIGLAQSHPLFLKNINH